MSGYDMILFFQRRHKLLLSPGSVYSTLYALERKGLVEGNATSEKRVYKLSKKGQARIEEVLNNRENIQLYVESLI
jgi:DNA-binding PadR family transcriptional regulator